MSLRSLSGVADSLRRVNGFRRVVVAASLGGGGALAFEPLELFPLLLLAYAGMVLILDGVADGPKPLRNAAFAGWGFGFGFFLVGLYWIGYAFLVDPDAHLWQLPFAAVALPTGMALFYAAAAVLCVLGWRKDARRIFVFALIFFAAEWARGHVLTGFPWNLPAYGWGASTAMLQSASLFGAYGLSLLTLLLGASFAALVPNGKAPPLRALPYGLVLFFIALWGNGEVRLLTASDASVAGVQLRIVQPGISETEKYVPQFMLRNWRSLIDLSNTQAAVPPTHIIWPEAAAIPPQDSVALARVPTALADIAQLTGDSRVLMTGDVRIEGQGAEARFYNSFALFGPHGNLLEQTDKFHLVPFGEYLPLESVLRALGFSEIAANTGFSSGAGPRTLTAPGAPPFTPLICYEVIFPNEVTGVPRPEWLVNMTDDSWFGPNTGPMQHLLIARVRAIEEGLPIARAANTGISAVIDSYGRVRARLALGLRGVLDAALPVALPATPFARYGNGIIAGLVFFFMSAALWPLTPRQT